MATMDELEQLKYDNEMLKVENEYLLHKNRALKELAQKTVQALFEAKSIIDDALSDYNEQDFKLSKLKTYNYEATGPFEEYSEPQELTIRHVNAID